MPDILVLSAALLTGVMGGVHCAAMCGGIATGFSVTAPGAGLRYALTPNLGRVLGYMLAGALVGLLGHGLVEAARSSAVRSGLRVATGAMLALVALRMAGMGGCRGWTSASTRCGTCCARSRSGFCLRTRSRAGCCSACCGAGCPVE